MATTGGAVVPPPAYTLPATRPAHAATERDTLDAVFRACVPCLNRVTTVKVDSSMITILLPSCTGQKVTAGDGTGDSEEKDTTFKCQHCATKSAKACVQVIRY